MTGSDVETERQIESKLVETIDGTPPSTPP